MPAYHMPPLGAYITGSLHTAFWNEVGQTTTFERGILAIAYDGTLYDIGVGSFKVSRIFLVGDVATGNSYNYFTIFNETDDISVKWEMLKYDGTSLFPRVGSNEIALRHTAAHHPLEATYVQVFDNVFGFDRLLISGNRYVSVDGGFSWKEYSGLDVGEYGTIRPYGNDLIAVGSRGAFIRLITWFSSSSANYIYTRPAPFNDEDSLIMESRDIVCIDPKRRGHIIMVNNLSIVATQKTGITATSHGNDLNLRILSIYKGWVDGPRDIQFPRQPAHHVVVRPLFPSYTIIPGAYDATVNPGSSYYSGPLIVTPGNRPNTDTSGFHYSVPYSSPPTIPAFGSSTRTTDFLRYSILHDGNNKYYSYPSYYLVRNDGTLYEAAPQFFAASQRTYDRTLYAGVTVGPRGTYYYEDFNPKRQYNILFCKPNNSEGRFVWIIETLSTESSVRNEPFLVFVSRDAINWYEDEAVTSTDLWKEYRIKPHDKIGYNPVTHSLYITRSGTEKINGSKNDWGYGQRILTSHALTRW